MLPHAEAAIIPQDKITRYLLNVSHPEGRSKALFFQRFGFQSNAWPQLADAIRMHARSHPVTWLEDSPFGTRYVLEGILQTPSGRTPRVRTVWFIRTGESIPRFVTAYPLKETRHDT